MSIFFKKYRPLAPIILNKKCHARFFVKRHGKYRPCAFPVACRGKRGGFFDVTNPYGEVRKRCRNVLSSRSSYPVLKLKRVCLSEKVCEVISLKSTNGSSNKAKIGRAHV